jgi:glycerophosphoryl diester phosphodiesterase
MLKHGRLKAAFAIMIAAAVFAALVFLIALAYQKSQDSRLLKQLSEKDIQLSTSLTVTAQTGCLGTVENSFLSAKTGVNSGANRISADISFNKDGIPVLAAELADADSETAVTLERVLEYLADKDSVSMFLNLKQVTNLPAIQQLVKDFDMENRVFYTGANENHVPFLQSKSPSIAVYLDMSPRKSKIDDPLYCAALAESAVGLGVLGVNCPGKLVSKTLVETFKEYGLLVSVYGVEKEADFYRMLDFGVDNITTKDPKTLITIIKAIQAKAAMR